ncbi:MAG: hypothetical protein JWN08_159 [Frankiales bacterium]|nr:hypothetical protein [Frankiales bacterium]
MLIALTAFLVVFLAELPDKSMLVCLVLGTHYRAAWVWLGAAGAFLLHVGMAVTAGGLLSTLPRPALLVLFVGGLVAGVVALLRAGDAGAQDEGAQEASELASAAPERRGLGVVGLSFGAVFVGEWGDVTQIATANLAAGSTQPFAVGVGALLALCSVVAIAVTVGSRVVSRLPVRVLRRAAALVLALVAVGAVAQAA